MCEMMLAKPYAISRFIQDSDCIMENLQKEKKKTKPAKGGKKSK